MLLSFPWRLRSTLLGTIDSPEIVMIARSDYRADSADHIGLHGDRWLRATRKDEPAAFTAISRCYGQSAFAANCSCKPAEWSARQISSLVSLTNKAGVADLLHSSRRRKKTRGRKCNGMNVKHEVELTAGLSFMHTRVCVVTLMRARVCVRVRGFCGLCSGLGQGGHRGCEW